MPRSLKPRAPEPNLIVMAERGRSRGTRGRGALDAARRAGGPRAPRPASAQGYRGWASTSLQMVEMRPLGLDTVPRADVVRTRRAASSTTASRSRCVLTNECTGYLPLPEERTLAATEDVSLTMWGLGMQGLSATAMVRVRAHAGGDLVWPRYDRDFDAMLAYAQLQRGPLRLRAGRQEVRSGLGFSAFDGLSAVYAYSGRCAARSTAGAAWRGGCASPRTRRCARWTTSSSTRACCCWARAWAARLFGVDADARYHREILSDRSSLVSERASLDISAALPGSGSPGRSTTTSPSRRGARAISRCRLR